jgi:hypothetical protein
VKVGTNVATSSNAYWQWFFRIQPDYEIKGKYLFFSTDRDKLVKIAIQELENNCFM